MTTTRVDQLVRAAPAAVYAALVDPVAVQTWMVPDDMSSEVHEFDARVGGRFRITLTYDDGSSAGKSGEHSDSFTGRFSELVPGEAVVQLVEFETDDAAVTGEMRISFLLRETDEGTVVVGVHENLPVGVSPDDNEVGWRMSLTKLAQLVERGERIRDAHDASVAAGEGGYLDPESGLFVMNESTLLDRGSCCGSGCRHCPY